MPPTPYPRIAPLPPIGRARQVADALSSFIDEARLGPGDRLPTERALMAALGIGRSSVREAVSQLQALGVLETRIGSGTYVCKPVSARTVHLPLSIDAHGLADGLILIRIAAVPMLAHRRARDLIVRGVAFIDLRPAPSAMPCAAGRTCRYCCGSGWNTSVTGGSSCSSR